MQTILGSGGSIGTDLARALKQYTNDIRLVSRNPVKVNETDTLLSADLTDVNQISKAIAGSEICYVTVGFEYKTSVWQKTWPAFMKATIAACIEHNTKLVFFDNVYAIGKDQVHHITEQSPISPSSKKGEVRAELDRMILSNVEQGKLQAIIARSPDFFGPVKKQNSLIMNMIYDNFVKGKGAQWLGNADMVHTMGYTPDLAKGTAILGNTPSAYNQIWNLPVDMNALTGREWATLFAKEMNAKNKIQTLPLWMLKLLGLFIPVLKEMVEMNYQFDRPYVFDCSKFNKAFDYKVTSNEEAVKQTVAAF